MKRHQLLLHPQPMILPPFPVKPVFQPLTFTSYVNTEKCVTASQAHHELFLLSFNATSSLSVIRSKNSARTIVIAKHAAEKRNGLPLSPK